MSHAFWQHDPASPNFNYEEQRLNSSIPRSQETYLLAEKRNVKVQRMSKEV